MVDAAVDWAKNRNLWRVNPIHKEEEIKIVVEDFFKYTDQQSYETSQRGTMEMEDPCYQVLTSHVDKQNTGIHVFVGETSLPCLVSLPCLQLLPRIQRVLSWRVGI